MNRPTKSIKDFVYVPLGSDQNSLWSLFDVEASAGLESESFPESFRKHNPTSFIQTRLHNIPFYFPL